MRARDLTTLIEIWDVEDVRGAGGGTTGNPVLLTTVWAKIKTIKSSKAYIEAGLDFSRTNLEIKIRYTDIVAEGSATQFIEYKGKRYDLDVSPVNQDLTDTFITLIGTEIRR